MQIMPMASSSGQDSSELLELYEPPGFFSGFEAMGTTPTLLFAEAWKMFSKQCKGTLLRTLENLPSAARLLDQLTGAYAAKHGTCAVTGGQEATTGSTPSLAREPFETAVAAFWLFETEPEAYGWTKGSEDHVRGVKALRGAIRQVLETSIPGPWAGGWEDNWLQQDCDSGRQRSMSDVDMDSLLLECCEALIVRCRRNESAAHPFSDPDASTRMLELLKRVVASDNQVVAKMPRLAQATARYVEQELEVVADRRRATHMPRVPVFSVDSP